MEYTITDLINEKYGSQANCARAMNWQRQKLNKIVLKQREAKVSDINLLADTLQVSVSTVVNLLS